MASVVELLGRVQSPAVKNQNKILQSVNTATKPVQTTASSAGSVVNGTPNVNGVVVTNNNPAQTGVSNVSYHDFSPNIPSANGNGIFNQAQQTLRNAYNLAKDASNTTNEMLNNGWTQQDLFNVAQSQSSSNGGGNYTGMPNQNMDYMNQLSAMLQAQQAQQQAALQANQQEHQRLIEQAYQNNLNSLRSAYGTQASQLGDTYNSALGQLEDNYNYSQNQLNQNAENALREAYINRMMAEKNLSQRLNAQGLTGGAAESVIASLLNNYGSARNSIETQRLNDLADLLNTYQNNTQSARQQYTDALNDLANRNYNYERQLQNDLANGVIGTYDDLYGALNSGYNTYANAMQGLAANQVNNAADLAAANYRNMLNAANKASSAKTTTKSGSSLSTTKGTDSSMDNAYRSRIAAGADLLTLIDELVNSGAMNGGEAVEYLSSLGAKFA